MKRRLATPHRLCCVECGRISDRDTAGWRAYISFLEEDGEPPEVIVFCPECVESEVDEK